MESLSSLNDTKYTGKNWKSKESSFTSMSLIDAHPTIATTSFWVPDKNQWVHDHQKNVNRQNDTYVFILFQL